MSILSAFNVSLSFGALDLFKGISVTVANDSKIGIIGPNGVGKTSLMLVLASINQPNTGQVHLARGKRLGYLRQEAVDAYAGYSNTLYAEMLTIFNDLQVRQAHLHKLEARMAEGDYNEELLQQYGLIQEEFERVGGYDFDLRIQQTLERLGLGKKYWQMPLNHLSGGQRTRALLARLLLEKPDLLMLDEPTNHLDIEAVEWLEHILHEWEGAVLIVSHDRYFLDNTVNTIWEMSPTGIDIYSGNYSAYLMQRVERWERYQKVFEEEKGRMLSEVDYIQHNMVRDSTRDQAMGRLRRLARDLVIVENYGIMALRSGITWRDWTFVYGLSVHPLTVSEAIRKVNALSMPAGRPLAVRPRLTEGHTSGTTVLRARDMVIGYPQNPLFKINELELTRGECAALIGPNGTGKTTFVKVLLGQVEPLQGCVQLGESLKIGYFAQAHDGLTGDRSVLDELIRYKSMGVDQARSYLAPYLFRGRDVFKPVGALSGGERARLALAILSLDGANFLLLDEPTNHLDIPARESLQEVLEAYSGTILLVSHDRYLINRLATQIWELRDGQLFVFRGTYREFLLRQATGLQAVHAHQVLLPQKQVVFDNSREARRRVETLTLLEDRIQEQETKVQRLSSELERAGKASITGTKPAFEHMQKLGWEIAQAQARLDSLMAEWERLVV
jgi:ATP-binding cassette subfamily F protein 3